MIAGEQWKQDMFDGIVNSFLNNTISVEEAGKLRLSVKEPIDELRAQADTNRRLNNHKGPH